LGGTTVPPLLLPKYVKKEARDKKVEYVLLLKLQGVHLPDIRRGRGRLTKINKGVKKTARRKGQKMHLAHLREKEGIGMSTFLEKIRRKERGGKEKKRRGSNYSSLTLPGTRNGGNHINDEGNR